MYDHPPSKVNFDHWHFSHTLIKTHGRPSFVGLNKAKLVRYQFIYFIICFQSSFSNPFLALSQATMRKALQVEPLGEYWGCLELSVTTQMDLTQWSDALNLSWVQISYQEQLVSKIPVTRLYRGHVRGEDFTCYFCNLYSSGFTNM